MPSPRQRFGQSSESLAARYLKKAGYTIIERNHRNRMGEIDIIARDGGTLVFVEVKARRSTRFGGPKHAVTRQKQLHLSRAALLYLKETEQFGQPARFDVVALTTDGAAAEVEIVKNAFELAHC
jgi:putative endonuclease